MIGSAEEYIRSVNDACSYITDRIGSEVPKICIVLGSGLSPLAEYCDIDLTIPYADIPGFPVSTVQGHDGKLIIGSLDGKRVFMMSGRCHYYEGYDTAECTFYIRVMSRLGVETLYLTNASGGIGYDLRPAELMIITDHISFNCDSPLRGPNLEEFGVRFPDQTYVYDRDYISKLERIGIELNLRIHKGIYAYTKGPQYETPAEIRALRTMGADAVGMSTVPEAIVAAHCGMRVAAVSCITNFAAGITPNKLNHSEVIKYAKIASVDGCELARKFIQSL